MGMGRGRGMSTRMGSRLLIASALALALAWTGADRCGDGSKGGRAMITVDVTSRRNATGHRLVKADLVAREDNLRNGAVDFRVEQDVFVIGVVRYVRLTASTNTLDQRVPPPGYELVPGVGWYRLHLTPLTWEEARLACEAEGAHLAVLNSQEEAAALKGIFARAPATIPQAAWANFAYIGFSDATEGHYITIFGQTLEESGYAEWITNQPDNAKSSTDPDSDCGGIVRQNGKLNDLPCRERAAYFCEFSL
ncbi:hypothetical protein R5R35_009038 [Gryllus longicercus]|uniref:C-type lectin domain-containing protein n=2 Tax=Gryllus longicercus TaxID=2509291 RepID=A0AAN9VXB7_9ORTH